MFKSAIFAMLAAFVSAETVISDFNIATDSKMGKRLLSKARRLEQNGQQNQEAGDWLVGYSIKYTSCSSLIQIREEGGGEDEGLLYTSNLVKFVICPGASSGCSDCGSGIASYVVNMKDFVEAYTQMKEEEKQQACETVKEYCYCDNANDDQACENQCYADAGMDDCVEYEGQEEMNIAEFMECAAMEGADGNNQNNGNNYYASNSNSNGIDMYRNYYIGPMCARDGKSIYLAAYYDAGCTSYAGSGVYEAFHYGYPLPYEKESIVKVNDCISCLQVDQEAEQNQNQNGQNYNYNYGYGNQNQNQEVAEICQQSYEMAAKCESKLSKYLGQYFYADTSGCDYINNILPNLSSATKKIASGSSSPAVSSPTSTAFAVVFGLTTLLLGAYSFFLYRKIHRAKVNLAQAEMGIA